MGGRAAAHVVRRLVVLGSKNPVVDGIQTEILFLEVPPGEQPVSERRLRDTVLKSLDWAVQRERWRQLLSVVLNARSALAAK